MSKERIIEEAKQLFSHGGIKNTTMDDIARELGISKRTIYENFKDKEEMLVACIESACDESRKFSEQVFAKSDNVIEAVIILLRKGTEQARRNPRTSFDEIRKYYPKVYEEQLLCRHSEKLDEMKMLVRQGISEGVFRKDLNPEIVAYLFTQQADGIMINDKGLDSYSLMEVFENMALSYIRGLCTPKGLYILDKLIRKYK
jgi:AcrR family transcriptional regulator